MRRPERKRAIRQSIDYYVIMSDTGVAAAARALIQIAPIILDELFIPRPPLSLIKRPIFNVYYTRAPKASHAIACV